MSAPNRQKTRCLQGALLAIGSVAATLLARGGRRVVVHERHATVGARFIGDFQAIEEKWQAAWEADRLYSVSEDPSRPKKYVLEMFPYPSGSAHMGHVKNYTMGDIIARFRRHQGQRVLHPMGYDAFGLNSVGQRFFHG